MSEQDVVHVPGQTTIEEQIAEALSNAQTEPIVIDLDDIDEAGDAQVHLEAKGVEVLARLQELTAENVEPDQAVQTVLDEFDLDQETLQTVIVSGLAIEAGAKTVREIEIFWAGLQSGRRTAGAEQD